MSADINNVHTLVHTKTLTPTTAPALWEFLKQQEFEGKERDQAYLYRGIPAAVMEDQSAIIDPENKQMVRYKSQQ